MNFIKHPSENFRINLDLVVSYKPNKFTSQHQYHQLSIYYIDFKLINDKTHVWEFDDESSRDEFLEELDKYTNTKYNGTISRPK